MKVTLFLISLLFSAISLPTLVLGGGEGEDENDEYGIFQFSAQTDFTNGSIDAKACVSM